MENFLDPVFFDMNVIAVNKPIGWLTIPSGFSSSNPVLKTELEKVYGKLFTVHRLDKETSGLLIFARDKETHRELNMQFEKRLIHKEYMALVEGLPIWNFKSIQTYLKPNGDRKHRTIICTNGKKALTDLAIMQRSAGRSLILVKPHTGITHQIRCHLATHGFPIVGDELYHFYCNVSKLPNKNRLFLHATKIIFTHPASKVLVKLESRTPEEFYDNLTINS